MLPDRQRKLLRGEEIINSKNTSLKDLPSGCKEYAPNNSWLEGKQIQATLETYYSLVSSERVEKKSNLSTAVWLAGAGKAKVTKKCGKHWETFGHSVNSEDWLLPEEALFLLETSALELYLDDVPVSIEQAYCLIIGEHYALSDYRVYSHLARKGYRLMRHDKGITVTSYEKRIRLDQVSLAAKRVIPDLKKAAGENSLGDEEASLDETAQQPGENNKEVVIDQSENAPFRDNNHDTTMISCHSAPLAAEDENISQEKPDDSAQKPIESDKPLITKLDSSQDLILVENEADDIIEIDMDDSEESDVEITAVKTRTIDTVDLMDSDEDDDVVFVCQKSSNTDPSKWRKWFKTAKDFLDTNGTDATPRERNKSKIGVIDLFDLANKSVDSIMKAIPQNNGRDEFIKAPDQRFIPSNILPKCAHYKIKNVNVNRVSPVHSSSCSLEQVRHGEESYRNSYSFHRTRPFRGGYRFNGPQTRPFYRNYSHGGFYNGNGNNSSYFNHNSNYRGRNESHYQNFSNHGSDFRNQIRPYPPQHFMNNFAMNQSQVNNVQDLIPYNSYNSQSGHTNQLAWHQNNHYGNHHNSNESQMTRVAVAQARQSRMLAMSVLESSQAVLQLYGETSTNNLPFGDDPFVDSNSFGSNSYRSRRPYNGNFRGRRNWNYNSNYSPPVNSRVVEITDEVANIEVPDEVVSIEVPDEDVRVKPALKRSMALNAIVNVNASKKSKIASCADDKRSVKSESPKIERQESVESSQDKQKPVDVISVSSDVEMEEVVSVQVADDRSETVSTPLSSTEVASLPSVALEDSMESVPVEIVEVPAERVLTSPNPNESNSNTEHQIEPIDPQNPQQGAKPSESNLPAQTTDTVPSSESVDGNGEVEGSNEEKEMVEETSNADQEADEPSSWETYKAGGTHLTSSEMTFRPLLTYDDDHAGVKDILQSLQVIGPIDDCEPLRDDIKVAYDVYLPNQPFKKSLKLVPNYRVIVSSGSCFPSIFELNHLRQTYKDGVPFLHAVVYEDSIAFFQLRPVSLPTLTPKTEH